MISSFCNEPFYSLQGTEVPDSRLLWHLLLYLSGVQGLLVSARLFAPFLNPHVAA